MRGSYHVMLTTSCRFRCVILSKRINCSSTSTLRANFLSSSCIIWPGHWKILIGLLGVARTLGKPFGRWTFHHELKFLGGRLG